MIKEISKAISSNIKKELSQLENISTVNSEDENEDDNAALENDEPDDMLASAIEKLKEKGYNVICPNAKHKEKSPKYQNVSELLKYQENDKENSTAIKLVIMNFND